MIAALMSMFGLRGGRGVGAPRRGGFMNENHVGCSTGPATGGRVPIAVIGFQARMVGRVSERNER